MFSIFILGWTSFFVSNILQVWIYFERAVATFTTVPLLLFVVAIFWYVISLPCKLRLSDAQVVAGKIDQFQPYEFIGDLDEGLHRDDMVTVRATGATRSDHCPIQTDALSEFQSTSGLASPSERKKESLNDQASAVRNMLYHHRISTGMES